jgi:hypothetical protein
VVFARYPRQPHARLDFEAAEIIVLELGSEREAQVTERDLVLDEAAEQLVVRLLRIERPDDAGFVVVRRQAIRRAPDDLVTRERGEASLEVEIEGVQRVLEARIIAARVVVVRPQLQVEVSS